MSGSVNKVILVGNLGADPEIRSFQNGGKVANIRVATSENWKDRNSGERKEKTEWHSVAIFSEGLVNVVERYLRKGSKVYIEGKLQTRKWQDQQGQDRYTTEIALQGFDAKLVMLDGAGGGGQGGGGGGYGGGRSSGGGGGDWGNTGGGDPYGNDFGGGSSGGGFGGGRSGGGGRSAPPAFDDDLNDDVPF